MRWLLDVGVSQMSPEGFEEVPVKHNIKYGWWALLPVRQGRADGAAQKPGKKAGAKIDVVEPVMLKGQLIAVIYGSFLPGILRKRTTVPSGTLSPAGGKGEG